MSLKLSMVRNAGGPKLNKGVAPKNADEQVDYLLAQISLELCQVGLAVWRVCGV
jgi:hypothetical protein